MGYRKVYLTIEEEEDIERIKSMREKAKKPGAAYNAILKEGLALVALAELRGKGTSVGTDVGVPEENVGIPNHDVSTRKHRRRRRDA